MDIEDIPKDKTICVRSAGKEASSGNGQGMLKCFCTGKCMNNKTKKHLVLDRSKGYLSDNFKCF